MNQFLPTFLTNAEIYLADLRRDAAALENLASDKTESRKTIRQIFQTLHTLKGSAAIFDLKNVSATAHKLETAINRIETNEKQLSADLFQTLADGFDRIEKDLNRVRNNEIVFADINGETLNDSPENQSSKSSAILPTTVLPAPLLAQLTARERALLNQSSNRGNAIFVVEAEFEIARFARDSEIFRRELSKSGETIATLPGRNQSPHNLALQFVVASNAADAESFAPESNCKIVFSSLAAAKSNFAELCETAFAAGRQIAARGNQEIEFALCGDDVKLSAAQAAAVSIALLHTIRNAVAHGIESTAERRAKGKSPTGKVVVETERRANEIEIRVIDDGRGIDAERVRRKLRENANLAEQKNISHDESNLLEIIFAHGFSTAETLTENAGRGVGLDAVRSAIEKINGRIAVESESERGARFTITLPRAANSEA